MHVTGSPQAGCSSTVIRDTPLSSVKKNRKDTRQRRRNVSKDEKRKIRKNLGHKFCDRKGKERNNNVEGKSCNCPKKCGEKVGTDSSKIFHSFWNLGSNDKQNIYLYSLITTTKIKRRYKKDTKNEVSRRSHSFIYHLLVNGEKITVCKAEFTNVHCISRGRVDKLCQQLASGKVVPKPDMRGKHLNRPNRVRDEIFNSIHSHILSIPKYTSHYSRKQNPGKQYLDTEPSILSLYTDKYLPYCAENNLIPSTQDKYRRIFCGEYNLGFKLPKSDTCPTCDQYVIDKLKDKNNAEKLNQLAVENTVHLKKADAMQLSLANATEECKNSDQFDVITFDLQQTLPTTDLTSGPAFYSRKVWTYNLSIFFICLHK